MGFFPGHGVFNTDRSVAGLRPPSASGGMSSQIDAGRQAINTGSILSGLRKEGRTKPNTGTHDGNRGAADFEKAGIMDMTAQTSRALAGQNAQDEQVRLSKVLQAKSAFDQQRRNEFQARVGRAADQDAVVANIVNHHDQLYWNRKNFLGGLIQ